MSARAVSSSLRDDSVNRAGQGQVSTSLAATRVRQLNTSGAGVNYIPPHLRLRPTTPTSTRGGPSGIMLANQHLSSATEKRPAINPTTTVTMANADITSFRYLGNNWTIVPSASRAATLDALLAHVHSIEALRESKFLLKPYDEDDIAVMSKCINCGGERHFRPWVVTSTNYDCGVSSQHLFLSLCCFVLLSCSSMARC